MSLLARLPRPGSASFAPPKTSLGGDQARIVRLLVGQPTGERVIEA